ncbi:hypothetical protein L6R52_24675 [Myxococcota bacterium]|nr:hypothetical protein [Myxococcota bacterium]
MAKFDENLDDLFKAAMADPSVTGSDASKKKAQATGARVPAATSKPAGRTDDLNKPAPSRSTIGGTSAKQPTLSAPAQPAAPKGRPTDDLPPPKSKTATTLPPELLPPKKATATTLAPELLPPKKSASSGNAKPVVPEAMARAATMALPMEPAPQKSPTLPPSRSVANQPALPKTGLTGASVPAVPSRSMSTEAGASVRSAKTLPPGASLPPTPASSLPTHGPGAQGPMKRKVSGHEQPRTNLKLIDYANDEPLVDHKGRSRPMYEPRTPRPRSWRPSRPIRLLLGLMPGTRVMALESPRDGLPYLVLGLLALLPALFLVIGWPRTVAQLHSLAFDDRWMLAHAALVVVLLVVFEGLRLASFFEEHTGSLKAPRVLAALLLPSIAIAWKAPELVGIWPQLVEASWFASIVLAIGGLAGTVWCVGDGTLSTPRSRMVFRIVGLVVLIAAIAAVVVTEPFGEATLRSLAAYARASGFRTLPGLLGG